MISINLFKDSYLIRKFSRHAKFAICQITGDGSSCIDTDRVRFAFKDVIDLYIPYDTAAAPAIFSAGSAADDGVYIWDCLQEDFEVFNDENSDGLNRKIIWYLYQDRKGDGPAFLTEPVYRFDRNSIEEEEERFEHSVWEEFKDELRYRNRFFPSKIINVMRLRQIFRLRTKKIRKGMIYYRARKSRKKLCTDAMGAPPSNQASAGRANPRGISYLYLGSDKITCEKEIKIKKGKYTLGTMKLANSVKVVDLTSPYLVSPFIFKDRIRSYLDNMEIMDIYARELANPADVKDPYFDYLPTQYICELMKKYRFDGILYRSSLFETPDHTNLALFDQNMAMCIATEIFNAESG